jgi:hypothetical protein
MSAFIACASMLYLSLSSYTLRELYRILAAFFAGAIAAYPW